MSHLHTRFKPLWFYVDCSAYLKVHTVADNISQLFNIYRTIHTLILQRWLFTVRSFSKRFICGTLKPSFNIAFVEMAQRDSSALKLLNEYHIVTYILKWRSALTGIKLLRVSTYHILLSWKDTKMECSNFQRCHLWQNTL